MPKSTKLLERLNVMNSSAPYVRLLVGGLVGSAAIGAVTAAATVVT